MTNSPDSFDSSNEENDPELTSPEHDSSTDAVDAANGVFRIPENTFIYEFKTSRVWLRDDTGQWISLSPREFAKHIAKQLRLRVNKTKTELISPTDQYINEIIRRFSVNNIASLAGYSGPTTLHWAGKKIFIPDGPELIEPAPGLWPLTFQVLNGLLEDIQFDHFKWWLHFALKCLYGGIRRPGQALFFCGERNSGKSLLQRLITLWMGGRMARPFRSMSGNTSFNSELFSAEHLMVEDEETATDFKARRKFAAAIKEYTANHHNSCHPKFQVAFTAPELLQRLTLSLNDEAENMTSVPPDEAAINDKVNLYKTSRHPMPMPTGNPEGEAIFFAALSKEAPAFIHHILNEVVIPEEWRCERYGVLHYHHPDLVSARQQTSVEALFDELIRIELFENPKNLKPYLNLRATQIEQMLTKDDASVKVQARNLLHWPSACGAYLGRLQKIYPNRYKSKRTRMATIWSLYPPETQEQVSVSPRTP